jgi:hypothetical protein
VTLTTLDPVTITAPTGVDGFGEVATLNVPADANFVGYLFKSSGFGGAVVRTSQDDIPQGHGAVFGSFFYGARTWTQEIILTPSTTFALSDVRYRKLCRAFNAMSADGTMTWTEAGGAIKTLSFRSEQAPTDPDEEGHVLLAGISKDPRIYMSTPQTGSSPKTNNGTAFSPPIFTLTPTGGNVVLTNTTSGLGSPAVTLLVGASPLLATGSAVTVDFGAKTVTQGGADKSGTVAFPSSIWWALAPGVSNTWTVTNASSVSVSFRDAWLSA